MSFNPIKCVLLDKYIMKDINKFLDPRRLYKDTEKKRLKVINEIKEFWTLEIDDEDNCEYWRTIEKCELCRTPIMVEVTKSFNLNQFYCEKYEDIGHFGESYWFCRYCDRNDPNKIDELIDELIK